MRLGNLLNGGFQTSVDKQSRAYARFYSKADRSGVKKSFDA
jgi:hypothetical protein